MFRVRTALIVLMTMAFCIPGCGRETGPVPVSAAVAAPAEPPEPGRIVSGVVSFVVPEGTSSFMGGEPENGLMKGLVYLPGGLTLETVYIAGQEEDLGYAEDASVRSQAERWLESSKASMARDWTPTIERLEGPYVSGYYAIVKHDPESKPPNEYVRDLWPKRRYTLQGFFAVGGQVIGMSSSHDDDTGAANETLLSVIKTTKWAF